MRRTDADLGRRDCGLPDLALLLDAERLTERLERTLGHDRVDSVAITYLRYKPGQNCLAACRADVSGQHVDFIAKAFRPSAIGNVHKALTRSGVSGPLGRGRFLLDDSTVLISVFPNDGRLTRLAQLTSRDGLAHLTARLGAHPDSAVRLETLRHNPERRFVGGLLINGNETATVRCYTGQDYASLAAKVGALESRGPLRLARRLTRRQRWRVLAFEWLHGAPLDDAIRLGTAPPAAMDLVGVALAHLHSQEAPTLPLRTGASEAAAVLAVAQHLAFLHPPLGAWVRHLAERVAARLAMDTGAARPLHGDFYAKQVLLGRGTTAFIDLDEASLGHPAIDLARFNADLEATAISGHLDVDEIEPLVAPLLEGYRLTTGRLPSHLNLHIAAQLLRVAAHPFRRREPSWPDLAAAILERAQSFFDRDASAGSARMSRSAPAERQIVFPSPAGSCGSPSVASVTSAHAHPAPLGVVDPFDVTSDPLMPFLTQALNPGEVAPRLARTLNCLDVADDIRILGIAVMRHKPGRRCLIAYDLAVHAASGTARELAVMGKAHARGADTTTHDLQEMLWKESFGPFSEDAILIPEPLGVVKDLRMGVQRRVPGEPLTRLLEAASGLRLARRAAEAIHKLHRVSAPTARRHTVEDEMRILHERLTDVAAAHPGWQARIKRLLEEGQRLATRLHDGPRCGIHRDFYPDQVLVDGERLYLTDLDLYAQGPPALDVGNFLAHVDEYSLRHFDDADYLIDRKEMFIERYLQLSPATTRDEIHAWATLSLARHIAISTRFADRRPFTAALLDLCERRMFGSSTDECEARLACSQQKGVTS